MAVHVVERSSHNADWNQEKTAKLPPTFCSEGCPSLAKAVPSLRFSVLLAQLLRPIARLRLCAPPDIPAHERRPPQVALDRRAPSLLPRDAPLSHATSRLLRLLQRAHPRPSTRRNAIVFRACAGIGSMPRSKKHVVANKTNGEQAPQVQAARRKNPSNLADDRARFDGGVGGMRGAQDERRALGSRPVHWP